MNFCTSELSVFQVFLNEHPVLKDFFTEADFSTLLTNHETSSSMLISEENIVELLSLIDSPTVEQDILVSHNNFVALINAFSIVPNKLSDELVVF